MSVLVYVAVSRHHDVRSYQIRENGDGMLWFHVFRYYPPGTPCLYGFETFLSGLYVQDYHVEEITGLHVPAAWDRLREMIQDSAEWRIPTRA